jgi:type I restriction enzyme R subunit
VIKLEADAHANGAWHSYLIQHSAELEKSNTIAWTSHRLSALHELRDRKVFDGVVVITDLVIPHRQFQHTIYQFEQVSRFEAHRRRLAADRRIGRRRLDRAATGTISSSQ